jgi:hypothetical protein
MSLRTLTALVVISLLLFPLLAAAGSYGDGFAVGGILLPSGSGTVIGKTRLGDNMAIEVALSLATWSDSGNSSSDIGFGAGVLLLSGTESQFQPYWGGRLSIGHTSGGMGDGGFDPADWRSGDERNDDGGDDSHTTFGISGVFGAEYFITKRLSLEGEVGLGMYFGSFSLATETTLAGFIYL